MKYPLSYILCFCLIIGATACSDGVNETVESAYQLPLPPEPVYKFSRNGESSVNTSECQGLKSPIDRVFAEYLSPAIMGRRSEYNEAWKLYANGLFGLKPRQETAASPTHLPDREKVLKDFEKWFQTSARIAGLGTSVPSEHRGKEAVKGATGYVGNNIGDKDICFVDEKGIAVAEVFKYAIMGAVYLDKILNLHLDDKTLTNKELLSQHEQTQLVPGHNYTRLEHHWDLAYGYYAFWKPLAQADGLPALKESHTRIFNSFVRGREYMETFRYNETKLQADTIRQELSRVVGVRIINLLVGANTLANMNEDPKRAFRLLSQAYGLVYATQFTCNAQGKPLVTYAEVLKLLEELEKDGGLWDKKQLLGEKQNNGRLYKLAAAIGKIFGVSPEEIKK